MNMNEAVTNIIVSMVNNKFISTPEEASKAYETIFKAVFNVNKNPL